MCSLTRLDLRSNRLSHVSSDVFGSLVRLRFLDLSDNPLVIPGADAERLRHLTAVVKVIIATVPDQHKVKAPITLARLGVYKSPYFYAFIYVSKNRGQFRWTMGRWLPR